jgi:SAM-dependent methyltransferase
MASAHKHLLGGRPESMTSFSPGDTKGGESYDAVADAYDETFADIGVRSAEVAWIEERIADRESAPRLLEVGCGNGALLARLAPRLEEGIGVDISASMIDHARRRVGGAPHLRVEQIHGPFLPVADGSVDCVISMLSWRYLDWGPMLQEISRVLTPDGSLWVVDMVEKPARGWELPRMLTDRIRETAAAFRAPDFRRARRQMVRSSPWRRLVAHNPMRALHEYEWFFRSRFPEVKVKTLSLGRHARVMAYDCGAVSTASLRPLQYP